MFRQQIRQKAFWLIDKLKKNRIRKHYEDIDKIINNFKYAEITNNHRIQKLLNYSVKNTEYYQYIKKDSTLLDFPVVDKNIIRENYQSFQSKKYQNKKKWEMTTSGSTGTPFTVQQSYEKRYRVQAELIYFSEWANYKVGTEHVFAHAVTPKNKKSKIKLWMQNEKDFDVLDLSEQSLEKQCQIIMKKGNIEIIIGYASAIYELAKHSLEKGYKPNMYRLKGVITGTEPLYEDMREVIMEAFGCNVVQRYSNMENGILAHECTDNNEFHINHASYKIELLSLENDTHVEPGEIGRIIVTDLFNYAMPIIRYDTGDLGILKENSQCGIPTPILTKIEGRKVDSIYNTSGEMISPSAISTKFWEYSKVIKQFQFIQEEDKAYRILINAKTGYSNEKEILESMKDIVGHDSIIRIEYVKETPVLASGKRRYIKNNNN